MRAPDRADGVRLVTDYPAAAEVQAEDVTPKVKPSDEKIDACQRFGKDLAAAWRYSTGFGTGVPTTSLLDGSGTVVLSHFDKDYVVKFVRVESYSQLGVLGR